LRDNHAYIINLLEMNGSHLKEIHLRHGDNLQNLIIAKSCPNLKSLHTGFKSDETETLKAILNGCQLLESIKVQYDYENNLSKNELLEVIAECSPEKFHEIKIHWEVLRTETPLEELEPFFTGWAKRIPRKSLSLIIIDLSGKLKVGKENTETIEKFKELGVIRKFEIVEWDRDS